MENEIDLNEKKKILGKRIMEEMYCAMIDDETGEVCGNVDETFTAYCIKHCRSVHGMRKVKSKQGESK